MDLNPAIEAIREAVPGLIAVYTFGSHARGAARPGSDLDLALLAPIRLPTATRWRLQERLARILKVDVDLVDLRSVPTVMQKEVVATGTVVLEIDASARRAFEGLVLAKYARLNEERREILDRIGTEGRVHG